jgi:heme/copper-type cytochrome/quinol oxidase subunit 2
MMMMMMMMMMMKMRKRRRKEERLQWHGGSVTQAGFLANPVFISIRIILNC